MLFIQALLLLVVFQNSLMGAVLECIIKVVWDTALAKLGWRPVAILTLCPVLVFAAQSRVIVFELNNLWLHALDLFFTLFDLSFKLLDHLARAMDLIILDAGGAGEVPSHLWACANGVDFLELLSSFHSRKRGWCTRGDIRRPWACANRASILEGERNSNLASETRGQLASVWLMLVIFDHPCWACRTGSSFSLDDYIAACCLLISLSHLLLSCNHFWILNVHCIIFPAWTFLDNDILFTMPSMMFWLLHLIYFLIKLDGFISFKYILFLGWCYHGQWI